MSYRVFVSHSHADNPLCDRYVEALQQYKLNVWYDRSARAGGSLAGVIQRELQTCNALIVILTPASIASYWVQLEVDAFHALAANDPGRLILPVRIAICDVPLFLRTFWYVDAVNMPFESAIHEIVNKLGLNTMAPQTPIQVRSQAIALGSVETVYAGHSLPVTQLGWSPDGALMVSVSRQRAVHVWDPHTGKLRLGYHSHTGEFVNAAAWSADGSCVVSGDSGGFVNVWDAATGRTRLVMNSHVGDPVYDVGWSPDNTHIAIARASNIVQICDSQTGNIEFTYGAHAKGVGILNGVLRVAWSPDSMLMASSGWDKQVRVWDIATGTTICIYSEHGDNTINDLAWSPEGTRIATVGSDGTLQIWDSRSGHLISRSEIHPEQCEASVAWSPDALYLASVGFDDTIRLWNTISNGQASSHSTQSKSMRAVAWSPDGQYLAVANGAAEVQVWSVLGNHVNLLE